MKLHGCLLGLVLLAATTGSALAAPIVLNFENITPESIITNYYNGDGGAANNFGISFSNNAEALCLNTASSLCSAGSNVSRGGLGDPTSQGGALGFIGAAAGQTFANDAAGFTGGFSFFYSDPQDLTAPSSITIYSGLNGTGTLLATLDVSKTPADACSPVYAAFFCPFVAAGVSFSGTAESVVFNNLVKEAAFDDMTFGSATPDPSPIPEPSTLVMMLTGAGGALTHIRRRLTVLRT